MNLTNIILFLIIIIFLINKLSNGGIFTTINRSFNSCKNKINNSIGTFKSTPSIHITFPNENKFPNLDNETYELYNYINNSVLKNINTYKLLSINSKRLEITKIIEIEIINNLSNIFNNNGYSFYNIKLNQDIHYYEYLGKKEIEPFIFTSDIIHNNNKLCNITVLIDCILVLKSLFINNITILKQNNFDNNKDKSLHINNELINNMNKTFEEIPISIDHNDLFIKESVRHVSFNDTDNDLIPSIDNISM